MKDWLADDAPEEDQGQRRSKRLKKVPGSQRQSSFLEAHPLKVILHICDDESLDEKTDKLLTPKFESMLKLNVVCVSVESSDERLDDILCNFFPDDDGLGLPHQSDKLAAVDVRMFDERKCLRPYKWARHLAGLGFLPEVSPLLAVNDNPPGEITRSENSTNGLSMYHLLNHVRTILERVQSRVKAQLALV